VHGVAQTTTNTYDGNGQLLTTTDPNGGLTQMSWNPNGALTSRTDAASNTTTMTPDSLGRITQISDPAGNPTKIVYDAKDRMSALTDPYGNQTSFQYDDAGPLRLRRRRHGRKSSLGAYRRSADAGGYAGSHRNRNSWISLGYDQETEGDIGRSGAPRGDRWVSLMWTEVWTI
jgi:YD repeat-containing protein